MQLMGNRTAIGYIRVSTGEQSNSIEMQTDKIKSYCQLQGIELSQIIVDSGISGSVELNKRPNGSSISQVAKTDVVVWKLDRLFRDAADALNTTKKWDDEGVSLHIIDIGGSTMRTDTPMGRFMLTMMAGFAELERNTISERITNVLQHKKKNHRVYSGGVPYGFDRVSEEKNSPLVPNEKEQAIISWMKKKREEGRSLSYIARSLNERGVDTKKGGEWMHTSVNSILSNDLHNQTT